MKRFAEISEIFRRYIFCILLIFVCGVIITEGVCAKDTESDKTVDFVLLLDRSGSMGSSDEQQLYVSAAKMFVDMLPTESARLAIVVFGEDYGEEAYPLAMVEEPSARENRMVKACYDLQSITDQDSKEEAKEMIVQASKTSGDTTPIGYALTVANNILDKGNAQDGQAAIILMSDGRLMGQADNYDGDGWNYTSLDTAAEYAASRNWPVYGLELNGDGQNDQNTWPGTEGKHVMREVIPQKTGTPQITLNTPAEAEAAFADIFARFFDAESSMTVEMDTIENGKASMSFSIGELIAETNLTITGEIPKVDRIELIDPNGDVEQFSPGEKTESDRQIVFEDRYVTLKLFAPRDGMWTVNVYGTDGVEIGLYAVSIREMDILLSDDSPIAVDDIIAKGTKVHFLANYYYHENPYESNTVYNKIPAKLEIQYGGKAETIEMEGTETGYQAEYEFVDTGTYEVRVLVHDELFRNEDNYSNTQTYAVGNLPVVAEGTVPAQSMAVNDKINLNMSEYFKNLDEDPVRYEVSVSENSIVSASIDEKTAELTISAGQQAGKAEVIVAATDGFMEESATQSVSVEVTNQPLQFTELAGAQPEDEQIEKTINLILNKQGAPDILLKAAGVFGEAECEIVFSEYFIDPDDPDGQFLNISCSQSEEGQNAIAFTEEKKNSIRITANDKGSSDITITAEDANDSTVKKSIVLHVFAANAWEMIVRKFWIPALAVLIALIVLLAFLIAAFGGRKLYGTWDVTQGSKYEPDRRLGATKHGKKKKCRLDQLLDDLNMEGGYSRVEVVAGNNFNKMVFFKNLETLDYVSYDGAEVTSKSKLKKIGIGSKHSITLEKDGQVVTFERH